MTQFIELKRFCAFEDKTFGVLHIPQVNRRFLTVERASFGMTEDLRSKTALQLSKHCLIPKLYNLGVMMRPDLSFQVLIKGTGYMKRASFETGRNPYVWPPGSIMLYNDGQSFVDREIDSDALNEFQDYMGNLYSYGAFNGNNRVAMMVHEAHFMPEVSKVGLEGMLEEYPPQPSL